MSWLEDANDALAEGSEAMADWLMDEDEADEEFDPIENLRRKFETLGESSGLEDGLHSGENNGFLEGFQAEASRTFYLGRLLGAGKTALQLRPNQESLAKAIMNAEKDAKQFWVTNPRVVDESLKVVRLELQKIGMNIPEWYQSKD